MSDFGHVNSLRRHLILGCAIAALNAHPGFAQTAEPGGTGGSSPGGLEEIIVTAQKRSDRLIDVPISITAATGDQLAKLGVASGDDLQRVVPGFTAKPARTGVPIYSIRGIGLDDFGVGSSPTVSVSVDQVPLPFLIMTPAASMDIERVEVLKGPQGTLFGQNTTGGAINFIAAKPTANARLGADLTYGRFNEIDANGYISGPITDTLRFRIAAKHENRDGWQISETRPDDHLGTRDFTALRLLLDWTPADRLVIEFNANGWIDKSQTQASQFVGYHPTVPPGRADIFALIGTRPLTPPDARLADWFPGQSYRRDNSMFQFSVRGDWTASEQVTFTSISAYAKTQSAVPTDTSGVNFHLFDLDQRGNIKTFSQELRAAIALPYLNVTAGGNYQHDRTDDALGVYLDSSNSVVGPFFYNNILESANQKVDTFAGFASADIPITATVTAQMGARYTKQDRDFEGCLRDGGDSALANAIALLPTLAGLPYDPAPPGACVTLDSTTLQRLPTVTAQLNQSNVSWRAGVNWKPDTDMLVYANVTRGFKSGGFSPVPAVFAGQFKPVTQEQVTAYEIGARAALFERKLDVSAAVFYDDYLNKQLLGNEIFPPFGALPTLQNIPKSTAKGAELEASARPLRGLTLTIGVTYVDTSISRSFISSDPYGTVVDLKGESFPNAPRWQGDASAFYELPVSSELNAFFGGDVSTRSASQADFGNNPDFEIRPYTLVGLRAGIGASNDRWRVELWGKNVTDRFYVTNLFKPGDSLARFAGMPATYGVTLRTRF
ncbi:MAG TPA: TonB-dependent receptor [Steroidobacteraceae bacterium]|nr:TonB-dependent receptor [Steroidobacteraceae bacterium]